MTEVGCSGIENHLKGCKFSTNTSNCTHREDAGVRCRMPQRYNQMVKTKTKELKIREITTLLGRDKTLEMRVIITGKELNKIFIHSSLYFIRRINIHGFQGFIFAN